MALNPRVLTIQSKVLDPEEYVQYPAPPCGRGNWNLHPKYCMENVGAQTKKVPSRSPAKESFWNPLSAHGYLWTKTLKPMHLSGAAVKATKENVLDLAAAHRGPKECVTQCGLRSYWVNSSSNSRDGYTKSKLHLQTLKPPPMKTSEQNPVFEYNYSL
jgi:hypothetical protein